MIIPIWLFLYSSVLSSKRYKGKKIPLSNPLKTYTAGQCGATSGEPNLNTFLNLPKYRRRRDDEFKGSKGSKNKTESGRSKLFQQRIVGGAPASKNAWPWQVFLDFIRYSCGGTLMSNEWVITAVHCTFRHPKDSYIRLGVHNIADVDAGIRRKIKRVVQHPEFYKPIDWNNDISLIQMDHPVTFTEYIQPICLPPPDLVIPNGTPCVVSGWGRSRKGGKISDVLQEVAVKLMSEERCKSYEGYANQLTDSMICAGYEKGGRDACSGDSGGPMACKLTNISSFGRGKRRKNKDKAKKGKSRGTVTPDDTHEKPAEEAWVLYGITSWGAGCARERSPGVYVKVSKMINWINEITGVTFNGMALMTPETWSQKVGDKQDLPESADANSNVIKYDSGEESACGEVLRDEEGQFHSPGYPSNYPSNTKCEWKIMPQRGMPYIRLNVTDMKFDARSGGCFINDHIRVFDGVEKQIGTALCKTNKNGWIVTAKGGMTIKLETDSTHQKKGFTANYQLLKSEPSGCANSNKIQMADKGGFFMSTGFPGKYPENTECAWYIYSGQSNPILLQFAQFNLEGRSWDGTCKFDYVAVYEGAAEIEDKLINKICGQVKTTKKELIPKTHSFISASGEMFVKFKSDNSGVADGFYAVYRPINDLAVKTDYTLTKVGRNGAPISEVISSFDFHN